MDMLLFSIKMKIHNVCFGIPILMSLKQVSPIYFPRFNWFIQYCDIEHDQRIHDVKYFINLTMAILCHLLD